MTIARAVKTSSPVRARRASALRNLIEATMECERLAMRIYCRLETAFPKPDELRGFWFDMAQHESRHFGALALVAALLESAPKRTIPAGSLLSRGRVLKVRDRLAGLYEESMASVPLARAFEISLEIESSEIEELLLDLLTNLRGESERERALQLMIHDLGDLSFMIEKYTDDRVMLARADELIECEVGRLQGKKARKRSRARRSGRR